MQTIHFIPATQYKYDAYNTDHASKQQYIPQIHHPMHPHHIKFHDIHSCTTFDPSTFRYALYHNTPLHCRVVTDCNRASNAFTISHHQIPHHQIHHPKHRHHILLDHTQSRITFDPSTFRYALYHNIPLHQRVIIHYTNATNTLIKSHKHLITKYVTQNMPLSPHTHTPILVKLLTSPGSAARCTTHNILLHQRLVTDHSSPPNTLVISHKHLNTKYTTQHTHPSPSITHLTTPIHASLLTPPGSATRYTTHNIPLHQRIVTDCISAPNAFAISHKYLTTKYVTQHTHPSPSHT